MDTRGNIYPVGPNQQVKDGDYSLTRKEAELLELIKKEKRVEALERLRAIQEQERQAIPKRPRSVLPKKLRK